MKKSRFTEEHIIGFIRQAESGAPCVRRIEPKTCCACWTSGIVVAFSKFYRSLQSRIPKRQGFSSLAPSSSRCFPHRALGSGESSESSSHGLISVSECLLDNGDHAKNNRERTPPDSGQATRDQVFQASPSDGYDNRKIPFRGRVYGRSTRARYPCFECSACSPSGDQKIIGPQLFAFGENFL